MKRGIGFGKIGLNLGQMKIAEKEADKDEGGGGGFGSFGDKDKNTITNLVNEEDTKEESEFIEEGSEDIAKVMGFSGFASTAKTHKNKLTPKVENQTAPNNNSTNSTKKAQQFDVESMFATVAKSAFEKNFDNNQKLEEEGRTELNKDFVLPKSSSKDGVKDKKKVVRSDDDDSHESEDDMVGPLPPPPGSNEDLRTRKSDNPDADEEEEREETPVDKIPHSHEVELSHGDKPITSLALDPSGSRVITGSADYELKFWDFAGMDPSLRSFRKLRPCESHVLNHIEYSTTGDKILVCSGNSQPKVLDRDGGSILECVKGDQYVLDQVRNKGHTSIINSGNWHPKIKEEFLTCSQDCTMRLWLLGDNGRKSKTVIKCKNRKSGLKAIPTNCTYSRDGLLVCAVCNDGSIQMWDHRKNFVNVCLQVETAHSFGQEITGVQFAYDNRMLATRSNDETLKLWDIRSFKKPVHIAEGLFSRFDQTDVLFSPDDKLVVTCTSKEKGESGGKVIFYDRDTFKKSFEMTVGTSHCIRAEWHPKINQLLVGSGDGIVKVFYDPDRSIRGAKLCVVKKRTEAKTVNYITNQRIITPYALPMFRIDPSQTQSTHRQYEKARKDPAASKNPEKPNLMKGTGGRVAKGGSTLASFMAKQIAVKNKDDHIDPREAILRHAKDCEENPFWVSPAYAKNQPKPIFAQVDPDEPEEKRTRTDTFG